ncbi:hypothetical protein AB9F45_35805, partial [Rhizobium leguminosarum]
RDPIPTPNADTPRGPAPTPGIPDPIQQKPPLTPAQDPADTKNPQDPPLNPALLPIGDPAEAWVKTRAVCRAAPSSDPSGHLLPAGAKGICRNLS